MFAELVTSGLAKVIPLGECSAGDTPSAPGFCYLGEAPADPGKCGRGFK